MKNDHSEELYKISELIITSFQHEETEKVIRESQSNLQTLFDAVDDMLFILDANGRILKVNNAVQQYLGYTTHELNSMYVHDIHPPEYRQEVSAILEDIVAGNRRACPLPLIAKSGMPILVETKVSPGKWNSMDVLFGISRDITERNKAEEQLRESEAKYRFLTERMSDIVWTVDMDLRLTYESPSIGKVLGFTPEERIGRVVTEMMTPESCAKTLHVLRREFMRKHEKGVDPDRTVMMEMEFYHKTGSAVWFECVASAIRDDAGKAIGIHGVLRDITERKQVEKTLHESEANYKGLYDGMRDAVVRADMDGFIIECNESYTDMLGYSQEEISNLRLMDITPAKWHELERTKIKKQLFSRGFSDIYEKEYQKKNGTIFPVEVQTFLVRDTRGNPSKIWAIVRDISDRKSSDEELKAHRYHLEELVKERTAELAKLNEVLKKENDLRESTEAALKSREIELVKKQKDLEERNITLRILLENRDEDKSNAEQNIISNIKSSVFPYLEKLKTSGLKEDQLKYFSEVELHLKNIASSFVKELSSEYIGLSPHEIQVAYLIKEGKTSKEIAAILNISLHTVLSHRYKIRIKTGIKSKKINLRTFLQTLK